MMKEQLKEIRKLIENPENWTKRFYARDKFDREVYDVSEEACKWCLLGAINRIMRSKENYKNYLVVILILENAIRSITNHYNIVKFNDDPKTTHEDILNLLDKCIEKVSQ